VVEQLLIRVVRTDEHESVTATHIGEK